MLSHKALSVLVVNYMIASCGLATLKCYNVIFEGFFVVRQPWQWVYCVSDHAVHDINEQYKSNIAISELVIYQNLGIFVTL